MTDTAQRLQLSRKKGFNLQALSRETNGLEAVKADRTTIWGNPFAVGMEVATAEEAVHAYRAWMLGAVPIFHASKPSRDWLTHHRDKVLASLDQVRGKNIACWCNPGEACHADVLLEIATITHPLKVQG